MVSNTSSIKTHLCRKWIGFVWLMIEMNLLTTNIFGFPTLFKVLSKYGIYENYCQLSNSTDPTGQDCTGQTAQYQVYIYYKSIDTLFI